MASKSSIFFNLLLLLILVLVGIFLQTLPGLRNAENVVQDIRVSLAAKQESKHKDIVVVEITEQTYAGLQRRSPLDRVFLSQLLTQLNRANVSAIGVDILIDQATSKQEDDTLIKALNDVSKPIVFAEATPNAIGVKPWQSSYQKQFFSRIQNPNVQLANVELTLDPDGVVRRQEPVDTASNFVTLLAFEGKERVEKALTLVDYYGTQGTENNSFNVIRADLIETEPGVLWSFQKKLFAEKIVLIGVNVAGVDRFKTPFSIDQTNGELDTAGVFIHAHMLAQLLDGRTFPVAKTESLFLYYIAIVAIGFLVSFKIRNRPIRACLGIGFLLTIWGVGFYFALAVNQPLYLPIVLPSLLLIGAFILGSRALKQLFRSQRDYTDNVLRHYIPPTVVNELNEHPEKLILGGERRDMTFIFTDIANFTEFSEQQPPQQVTTILNQYLTGMSDIIQQHHGTIDKYLGDGIVAFFGAPIADKLQAQHAVRCAIALNAFSEKLKAEYNLQNIPFGLTRIGVHSGPATVGNFGSHNRYDYTAIGDTVNTTARLESANKVMSTKILVSAATVAQTCDIDFRLVGNIVLKGKKLALTVYEPVLDSYAGYQDKFANAIALLSSDLNQAENAFEILHQQQPHDPLIAFHLQRIKANEANDNIVLKDK